MSECKWGHGNWCMTHETSGSGICLKDTAALRAKVEELQATFDKTGDGPHLHLGCQRRERASEARVRELEAQVEQAAVLYVTDPEIVRLRGALTAQYECLSHAEAEVGRLIDWQAEATRLAVQVENLEHELGQVNERLRRIVGYINSVAKFAWEMKDDGVAADLARECARKAEIEEASGETACSCTTGEVRDPQDRVPAPAEA